MQIGEVVGNVVSTKKVESLTGYKLLIVNLIKASSKEVYKEIVAIDKAGAGRGDYVLVTQGSAARTITRNPDTPVDAAIVGIIDTFDE